MPVVNEWSIALNNSMLELYKNIIIYIPKLVLSILLFAFGWVIAVILARIVEQLLQAMKLDKALRSAGVEDFVEKIGFKLNAPYFLASLVKWFIIVVAFTTVMSILGLTDVTAHLWGIVLVYLPKVIIAVIILMITAIVAQAVYNLVLGAAAASGLKSKKFFANFAKWAIWAIGFVIVLPQLGIASKFIYTLFSGVVIALSLAFGLAFGLGGKEEAARILAKLRRELEESDLNEKTSENRMEKNDR